MKYLELVNKIKTLALSQPNVNSFYREFDKLNVDDVRYSCVVLQDTSHSRSGNNIVYSFYLGYIDRQNIDKSNTDYNWDSGMTLINNIANSLANDYDIVDVGLSAFTPITQRFLAECDIVYCTINVTVPITDCDYQYNPGAFNDDYNKDFDVED